MKQIPSLWGAIEHPTFVTPKDKQRHANLWESTESHTFNTRLDAEVIDAFKASGDDWQKRINRILRDAVKSGLTQT